MARIGELQRIAITLVASVTAPQMPTWSHHRRSQAPVSAASPANIESSIELPQGWWHRYLSSQRSCAVGPRSRVLIDSQQLRTVASLCNIVRSLLRQLHESPLDMLRLHQARSRAKGQLSARPASCGRYLRSPETGLAPRGRVSSLSKAWAPDINLTYGAQ